VLAEAVVGSRPGARRPGSTTARCGSLRPRN
jgi:hypothetical protein